MHADLVHHTGVVAGGDGFPPGDEVHRHRIVVLAEARVALGRALMDLAIRRLRFQAQPYFVKSFKPTLSIAFISRVLGFMQSDRRKSIDKTTHKKKGHKEATPLPGCSSCVFEGKNRGRATLQDAMADCEVWLRECGASIIDGGSSEALLDCKLSMGKLQLPDEKDAVAHGDAISAGIVCSLKLSLKKTLIFDQVTKRTQQPS